MINSSLARSLVIFYLCVFGAGGVIAQSDSDLVEQLRADYMALLDARIDFEHPETDPGSYTAEQADYADWIQQLSEQFALHCRELTSQSPDLIPADIPCAEFNLAYTAPAGIEIEHENSDGEQIAASVSKFDKSLGQFDEKLLREQDRVKARKPQASVEDSGGGDGSDSGSGTGSGAESGESENGATEGEQSGDQSEGQSNEQGGEQSNEQGSGTSSGGDQDASGSRGGSSRSSAPPDTPDGHDDDVIARQLREAAEKETDPELKRKLWEEYKRYKEGL
jgi:hypothetical protein